MQEMDAAMGDKYDIEEKFKKSGMPDEDIKLDQLNALGLNITKKP